ncbi:MAG: glucodextranase DOMON-like domain-containing protein [Acidimicrobiia bacterium]|nr:glucodextranase DOMON-like domain-containing protein [Acidimicrobiia bacterium]
MRRFTLWASVLLAFTMVAAACTADETATSTAAPEPAPTTAGTTAPTTAAPAAEELDPDGFYVMLMWHQHQPLYPKDANGVVTRPWVRVHATKDYYDMAALLEDYPDVHATFNLTPVLLRQLEELANGTRDIYWELSTIQPAELTADQRQFIQDRFFDVNPKVIARFPRFQELADRRQEAFNDDEIQDLQALFNLAWTDPSFLSEEPLASIVATERGFTRGQIDTIFDEHLRIIGDVFTVHRDLWDAGQIEVTTTPLAHPILPLIFDSNLASVGDPTAQLPQSSFGNPLDALAHVELGLAEAERLLGRRPVGMWPGEGAVAQQVMGMFARQGVRWVATGEDVLAKTLDTGFERDAAGVASNPEVLYRPWAAQLTRNDPVAMFFRDVRLSDLIGFEYSGMEAQAAADDLIARLEAIDAAMDEQGASGPRVVSIILDGENAWENYDNDGIDFLRAVYQGFSDHERIRTVTPTQLLDAFPDIAEPLPDVFPSAWFSPNFATWIGESEEAKAWDYLVRARRDLSNAEDAVSEEAYAEALELMYFAEGSDWFWWYGADQDSGDDGYFDRAYRELLGQMYDALGTDRPDYLSVPIIPVIPVLADRGLGELATGIRIDGTSSDEEWADAARYELGTDAVPESIEIAFDKEQMYVRATVGAVSDGFGFALYLSQPSGPDAWGLSNGGEVLGFDAGTLVEWNAGTESALLTPHLPPEVAARVEIEPISLDTGVGDGTIELAIPLEELGAIEVGDRITFRVAPLDSGAEGSLVAAAPAVVLAPDVSDLVQLVELTDPEGDDYGPGTYTYPTDLVFTAGSYDLTNFSVGESGGDLVFTFTVNAAVANPWGSPNGLSIQTFDVYIDQDPGNATGARLFIPGRNAALTDGNGWEYGLTVEGWDPALYVATADGTVEETKPTMRIIVDGPTGRVTARVPRALFGDGDPSTWGYAVAVMSQEGFPSGGVRRVRDVQPDGEQYRIGGGTGAANDTRIIDILFPVSGEQEVSLENPGADDPADPGPNEVAQVPLNTPQ